MKVTRGERVRWHITVDKLPGFQWSEQNRSLDMSSHRQMFDHMTHSWIKCMLCFEALVGRVNNFNTWISEDSVLFLWRVFKSKHFGFFFQSEMGSVWFSNLQQAYRVALWDKCAWIAACWIWGYLDSSLSPLAAGCRAVGISKWCECKRWRCREVLTSRALLFGSCSVNMETWWNWSSGYKASLPTFPYLSLTSEIRLGGHKKVVINSSV